MARGDEVKAVQQRPESRGVTAVYTLQVERPVTLPALDALFAATHELSALAREHQIQLQGWDTP